MHPVSGGRTLRWSRSPWAWARLAVGAAILAVLVWRLGPHTFLEPLRRIDAWSLAVAAVIAVPTTVCCAWRWRLVSRGLGSHLPWRVAVAAYYRSQFLNTVLPGGVLGDVNRGVRHGRHVGDVGHGLRAVAWERTAGQVVQFVLTLVVLLLLPSPVHASMPLVAGAVVAAVLGAVLLASMLPRGGRSRVVRIARVLATDVRHGLLARSAWPGVVLASTLALAGHTATFMVAARTAGSTVPLSRMLPLALLVLLAMSVPTNIAGWGPREGVAAWAFGLAGHGAAEGIATTVVYGAMVVVATLPGAALLVMGSLRPDRGLVRPTGGQDRVDAARLSQRSAR
jgi:glycosyltransferase 2 family protein